jgi:hypothetical protein
MADIRANSKMPDSKPRDNAPEVYVLYMRIVRAKVILKTRILSRMSISLKEML